MATIIAAANQKGGVGKTTLTYFLSQELTHRRGKKVLCVDLDGQGNLSSTLLTQSADQKTGERALAEPSGLDTKSLFLVPDCPLKPMTTPTGPDLIWVSQHTSMDVFAMNASGYNPATGRQDPDFVHMAETAGANLMAVSGDYDYVLLDCPPQLGNVLMFALTCCSYVFVPVKLHSFAAWGAQELLTNISEMGFLDKFLGIVLNQADQRSRAQERYELRIRAEEDTGDLFFEHKLFNRSSIDNALFLARPIWKTPGGRKADEELRALFDEMLEKIKNREGA